MPQDSLSYIVTNGDTVYLSNTPGDSNYQTVKNIPSVFQDELRQNALAEEAKKDTEGLIAFWSTIALLIAGIYLIARASRNSSLFANEQFSNNNDDEDYSNATPASSCFMYPGKDLRFSNNEVHNICSKYNYYYNNLSGEKKDIFISRLKKFLQTKTFYICSNKGYKEMPVLVSAAAVQITFGLDEFLLPHFENIVIHPQEYFGTNPLRILEGNVQGTSINLSWKHFLEDYQNPTDGKNVGLHEMAHALQVQYLFNSGRNTNEFKEDFVYFDRVDEEIMSRERNRLGSLFDSNALSNTNEFWATSVELFFEKPHELKALYPELYKGICIVLNQETALS